jgi:galactose mutarotase-like enzyme
VLPLRGALVARCAVDGRDLLYLDESTIDSPTGAVRGGIPLLFPFAGELQDGLLSATGTSMPRHGFGRRKPWAVADEAADRVVLQLRPDDETRAQFPFEFVATETVAAIPGGLRVELEVANLTPRPMPLAPGWHPYFPCAASQKRACLSQVIPAADLASEPVACDVNVAAPDGRASFELPGLGPVRLTFSDNLKTLEVWTPPAGEFVCVEPWVGPSNTINTPAAILAPPGARVRFWMTIEIERAAR